MAVGNSESYPNYVTSPGTPTWRLKMGSEAYVANLPTLN